MLLQAVVGGAHGGLQPAAATAAAGVLQACGIPAASAFALDATHLYETPRDVVAEKLAYRATAAGAPNRRARARRAAHPGRSVPAAPQSAQRGGHHGGGRGG